MEYQLLVAIHTIIDCVLFRFSSVNEDLISETRVSYSRVILPTYFCLYKHAQVILDTSIILVDHIPFE